jgi:DivIVA domain-containing protein
MTLSLDDVRNKRFRMARKGGYEVLEVDEFVDEVEESFAQLTEENASLKKQVEALRSASSSDEQEAAPSAAPVATEAPAPPAEAAPAATDQPADKLCTACFSGSYPVAIPDVQRLGTLDVDRPRLPLSTVPSTHSGAHR